MTSVAMPSSWRTTVLLIRIELLGAVSGKRKELGVIGISNVGGSQYRGTYKVQLASSLQRLIKGKV